MNCGNIKCAYKCVQKDQKIEEEKTKRITAICYAIRDFSNGNDNVKRFALELLAKVLKQEEII